MYKKDSFSAYLVGAGATADQGPLGDKTLDLSSDLADNLMEHVESKLDDFPFPDTPFSRLPAVPGIDEEDQRKKRPQHINRLNLIVNQINTLDESLSAFQALTPIKQRMKLIRGDKLVEQALADLERLNVDSDDQAVKEQKEIASRIIRNMIYKLDLLREELKTEENPILVDASK
jgi:hypothetical protein